MLTLIYKWALKDIFARIGECCTSGILYKRNRNFATHASEGVMVKMIQKKTQHSTKTKTNPNGNCIVTQHCGNVNSYLPKGPSRIFSRIGERCTSGILYKRNRNFATRASGSISSIAIYGA